ASSAGKLEKVRLLAEYLQSLDRNCVPPLAIWFTGLPFAPGENRVLQVGWALLRDALCSVSSVDEEEFHHVYLKHSDLGETAQELLERRFSVQPDDVSQADWAGQGTGAPLEVMEVQELFAALQSARGPSEKLPL